MSNEEYITLIVKLLKKFNTSMLERIYNYVNNLYIGRG